MRDCHEAEAEMQVLFFRYMLTCGKPACRGMLSIFPLVVEGDFSIQRVCNFDPRSRKFSTSIEIKFRGNLAWIYHDIGQYEHDAFALVHNIVREQHEKGVFEGGRGPRRREVGDYLYVNTPDIQWKSFALFSGNERVIRMNNLPSGERVLRGTMQYFGQSMLPEGVSV